MKHLKWILVLNLLWVIPTLLQASERIVENINFGWKFHLGDIPNAYTENYNDTCWRTLDLPHDFQLEQPWDSTASRARGFKAMQVGWYRKAFTADPTWKGHRVLLDFEGIMLLGDVWLNGHKIGGTDYGYVGFEIDITDNIRYDTPNIIAVRADTGKPGASRWYTGGGIYRDVHISVKDSISIARHGVFITTPEITCDSAQIGIEVEIDGMHRSRKEIAIRAHIYAPNGQLISTTEGQTKQNYRLSKQTVKLPGATVAEPQLWSCETPQLYSATVELTHNGQVIDRVTETFGIRTLEFSPQFGFKLNGKKLILKGISNHHDLGPVGIAAYERAIERQMKTIKDFGYNHIRTSHNPYSRSFIRMADKLGILIVNELYDKWSTATVGGRTPWQLLWPGHIAEWIKRDRNHPSVIMWSIGNELQINEEWTGYEVGDWGVTAYRILDAMVKRYDPTRKTTVGMYPSFKEGSMSRNFADPTLSPPELSTVTEVASYNYIWPAFRTFSKQSPHLIFYQSEAATREMGAAYYGMDLNKVVGLAYWGAIEYWGESQGWPSKGWHYSFFDRMLEPYPQAYFTKSMFTDEPLVHIGIADNEHQEVEWNDVKVGYVPLSSHWNREAGTSLNLFTYTNAQEVELLINGKSVGIQKNDTTPSRRNAIYWQNIPYKSGNILAIARNGGKEVARHQLETTGQAVALKIEIENPEWKADGMDLQYVRVRAVDKQGRTVPNAKGEVIFDVSGAARLIAVDNGDHQSNALCTNTNKCTLHNGRVMAVLRASQSAGEVKIKISTDRFGKIIKTVNTQ